MSDAADTPSRDEEMLARLAERDLSAAERVHDRLMAAEDSAEIAELGRTYQRLARSLRQTLALKARLGRDKALDHARANILRTAADSDDFRVEARVTELQEAVERIANAVHEPERREEVLDDFAIEVDDWIEEADFLATPVDDLVLRACRLLDLPEDLAPRWRALPRLEIPPDPEPEHPVSEDPAPAPRAPWRGSG